jgi:hypothetical protein
MRLLKITGSALLALAMLCSTANASTVDGPSNDISFGMIGHGKVTYYKDVKPGDKFSLSFEVNNLTKSDTEYSIYPSDQLAGELGGVQFYPDGSTNTLSGAWVEQSQSHVVLKSGARQEHSYDFNIPSNIKPGEYITGIVVTQDNKAQRKEVQQGDSLFIQEGRTDRFIQIVMQYDMDKALESLGAPLLEKFYNSNGTMNLLLHLNNNGTIKVKPEGKYGLTDESKTKAIKESSFQFKSVYVGSSAVLSIPVTQLLVSGRYYLEVEGTYGKDKTFKYSLPFDISSKESNESKAELIVSEKIIVQENNTTTIYILIGAIILLLFSFVAYLIIQRRRTKGTPTSL